MAVEREFFRHYSDAAPVLAHLYKQPTSTTEHDQIWCGWDPFCILSSGPGVSPALFGVTRSPGEGLTASWKLFKAPLWSESTRYSIASSAATAGGSGAFVSVDLSCPIRIIACVGSSASLVFDRFFSAIADLRPTLLGCRR